MDGGEEEERKNRRGSREGRLNHTYRKRGKKCKPRQRERQRRVGINHTERDEWKI